MPLLEKFRTFAHRKPERKLTRVAPAHSNHHSSVCPRVHPIPKAGVAESNEIIFQKESCLLGHLPLEVRQTIYHVILGIGVLHVLIFSGRLAFVACTHVSQRGESTLSHECWRLSIHEELVNRFGHRGGAAKHDSILGLLGTCRQAYTEAIEIFYSQNTFDFRHPENVVNFTRSIPSPWLHSVNKIHLSRYFEYTYYDDVPEEGCLARPRQYPDDLKTWEDACHALACMQRLEELCIVMKGSWIHHDPRMRILEPLRDVKVSGSFDVYMPIPQEVDCNAEWDASFNVIDDKAVGECVFCR